MCFVVVVAFVTFSWMKRRNLTILAVFYFCLSCFCRSSSFPLSLIEQFLWLRQHIQRFWRKIAAKKSHSDGDSWLWLIKPKGDCRYMMSWQHDNLQWQFNFQPWRHSSTNPQTTVLDRWLFAIIFLTCLKHFISLLNRKSHRRKKWKMPENLRKTRHFPSQIRKKKKIENHQLNDEFLKCQRFGRIRQFCHNNSSIFKAESFEFSFNLKVFIGQIFKCQEFEKFVSFVTTFLKTSKFEWKLWEFLTDKLSKVRNSKIFQIFKNSNWICQFLQWQNLQIVPQA